jgi:hypothetical protein
LSIKVALHEGNGVGSGVFNLSRLGLISNLLVCRFLFRYGLVPMPQACPGGSLRSLLPPSAAGSATVPMPPACPGLPGRIVTLAATLPPLRASNAGLAKNVNLTPDKPGASRNQAWEEAGVAVNVSLTPGKPEASFATRHEQEWDQINWSRQAQTERTKSGVVFGQRSTTPKPACPKTTPDPWVRARHSQCIRILSL